MPNLQGNPGALGPESGFPAAMGWQDGQSAGAPIPLNNGYGRRGRQGGPFGLGLGPRGELGTSHGLLQFVPSLLRFWRLQGEDAVPLLGFSHEDATHVTRALQGREAFRGRDVRERMAHLLWIRKTLSALFRDRDTENAWLREPHRQLDNRAPMDLLLGGSLEELLLVRDYADAASGV